MATISKILYATDFSKRSLAALPLAVDLAKRYGAEFHCVHVSDTHSDWLLDGGYMTPTVDAATLDLVQIREAAQTRLDQFIAEQVPDFADSVKKVILLGKPFVEIVRYARDEGIDLIVLGTHGHSALASMLLGSVTEKVVRKAPCAVLTVRHPEQRFEAP